MSFIIKPKQLKETVSRLAKVVPNNPTVPVLRMVKFSITDNKLRISGTDLTQQLSSVFNNSNECVEPDQSFLIEFSKLKEFMAITGNGKNDIYLDAISDSTVCLTVMVNDNQVSKKFETTGDEEWPEPIINLAPGKKFPARMLEAIRLSAKTAAGDDENRKLLKGVLLEPNAVVTTNGKQLLRFDCTTGVNSRVVIPLTKFLLLKNTAADGSIRITQRGTTQVCQMVTDSWEYEVKCLEGNYPNYKQVIPKDTANMIEFSDVDIKVLQTALPLFECHVDTEAVYLYSEADRVSLLSDDLATIQDTNAKYTGKALNSIFAVDRNILLDAFKLGFNKLKFNDPFSPVIAVNDSSDIMVFMTLRHAKSLDEVIALLKKEPTFSPAPTSPEPQPQQPNPQPEGVSKMEQNNVSTPTTDKEPQTTVNTSGFKVVPATAPVDPFDELFSSIATMKQNARATLDMATALQAKARAVQKHLKAKERDFKDTRELLGKLKKVSGF
jgi:DNA polymerase III sliding clamp (beta) subunit (PCNA family)